MRLRQRDIGIPQIGNHEGKPEEQNEKDAEYAAEPATTERLIEAEVATRSQQRGCRTRQTEQSYRTRPASRRNTRREYASGARRTAPAAIRSDAQDAGDSQ